MEPNPIRVAWSIWRARRVSPPHPASEPSVEADHGRLGTVLDALAAGGVGAIDRAAVAAYRDDQAAIDPNRLGRDGALAYWLNVYNAGALDLAAETWQKDAGSVLRVRGGFDRSFIVVGGEALSLNDIEHGKVRRFKDPRIHGALVCGSASCPTVRHEPYRADFVDKQLDDQLRSFFANGGAALHGDTLYLSRILMWYGGDFVRPHRMPTWLPTRRRRVAAAIQRWLPADLTATYQVDYQRYDWTLACSIR